MFRLTSNDSDEPKYLHQSSAKLYNCTTIFTETNQKKFIQKFSIQGCGLTESPQITAN